MFHRHGSSKDWVPAEGVILENAPSLLYRTKQRLVVGVKLDNGETVEFTEEITDFYVPPSRGPGGWLREMGGDGVVRLSIHVGDQIPVRCDPGDPTKLCIDQPALHEQAVTSHQKAADAGRAQAEAILEKTSARDGTPASTGGHGPVAGTDGARLDPELQELMDLEEAERHGTAGTSNASTPPTAGSQARLDRL
jgi:hypothetical protein